MNRAMSASCFKSLVFVLLAATVMSNRVNAQQIAFTWDDLPAHAALPAGETRVGIGKKLIDAMKAEHMPAPYGFVNGKYAEREPLAKPMLDDWRAAGYPLGNHTWSHLNLNANTVEAWEAEVTQNEPILKEHMGDEDWHWLRYPNLAEGNAPEKRLAARKFLAEHGYKIAGVTMSFADYSFNDPYARCVAKGDTEAITKLEESYLAAADATLTYSRSLSKTLYGRDIPYVLLMHVGGLDARMLPRLLQLYKSRGVTFVSLQDAEKDEFYKNDLDPSLSPQPDTLEEAMRMRGLPVPTHPRPDVDLKEICK